MSYSVVYWNSAPEDLYQIIRSEMPVGWNLITAQEKTPEGCLDQLRDADFLLAAVWPVGDRELRSAPKLKMVQHQGVGHEHIDKSALKSRGIPMAICPAGTTSGVAEHTMLLILAVYKRLILADTGLRGGRWLQWELRSASYELAGKTLGLVGFGRIGQAVARRAQAFDAKILYYDPLLATPLAQAEASDLEPVSFEDLLRRSDIVSIHCPATDATRKFLGEQQFRQMKRSAILINTARGTVVDEAALIRALRAGVIAGAGLDVYEQEPTDPANALLKFEQVVVTPHISAGTVDALREKMRSVFANLQRYTRHEEVHDRIV